MNAAVEKVKYPPRKVGLTLVSLFGLLYVGWYVAFHPSVLSGLIVFVLNFDSVCILKILPFSCFLQSDVFARCCGFSVVLISAKRFARHFSSVFLDVRRNFVLSLRPAVELFPFTLSTSL